MYSVVRWGRNRSPSRRLWVKSATLWLISMLFSLGGTTSCRVADTDDTGLEVVTACQPVQKNRGRLAPPFPFVMYLALECFFLLLCLCGDCCCSSSSCSFSSATVYAFSERPLAGHHERSQRLSLAWRAPLLYLFLL